jgi:hypothetical protein
MSTLPLLGQALRGSIGTSRSTDGEHSWRADEAPSLNLAVGLRKAQQQRLRTH